jgi:hypothetical protein
MIIVQPKPINEILEMVKNSKSILVVGCEGCSAVTQTGGEKQAESLALLLELSSRLEGACWSVKAVSTIRQCDRQIVASTLKPLMESCDSMICMGCGAGTQVVADIFQDKLVLPGIDTMFIGSHDRNSRAFTELCRACGECVLDETGGICPVTRCSKSLLNGPCGGYVKGKCEVGGWIRDCAWVQIFNRLKAQNRLDLYARFRPPRDYRTWVSQGPRQIGGVE